MQESARERLYFGLPSAAENGEEADSPAREKRGGEGGTHQPRWTMEDEAKSLTAKVQVFHSTRGQYPTV